MPTLTYNNQPVEQVKFNNIYEVDTITMCNDNTIGASAANFYEPKYKDKYVPVWTKYNNASLYSLDNVDFYALCPAWSSSRWIQNNLIPQSLEPSHFVNLKWQVGLPEFSSLTLICIKNNTSNKRICAGVYHHPDAYYTKNNYDKYFNIPHVLTLDKDMLILNTIFGNTWPRYYFYFDLVFSNNISNVYTTRNPNNDAPRFTYIHYTAATSYAIDGQYATKLQYVSPYASTIEIYINKYHEVLPYVTEDWHEIGYTTNGTSKTRVERYFSIKSAPSKWYDLKYSTLNTAELNAYTTTLQVEISNIVTSVDANNQFDVQHLTFHTLSNPTPNEIRYLFLTYSYGTNSSLIGYLPGLTGNWSDTKICFVQLPDEPTVFFGPVSFRDNTNNGNQYTFDTIERKHYNDYSLLTYTTEYNFNILGMAKWSTIVEWDYTLFDAGYQGSFTNRVIYTGHYIVAIPVEHADYIPSIKWNKYASFNIICERITPDGFPATFCDKQYIIYKIYSVNGTSSTTPCGISDYIEKIYLNKTT